MIYDPTTNSLKIFSSINVDFCHLWRTKAQEIFDSLKGPDVFINNQLLQIRTGGGYLRMECE